MTYVEPFAGAASCWLHLLDQRLHPPCAWMGGKRRLASHILATLGLRSREPHHAILGDAGWWGETWTLVLDPTTGPEVCAWLRAWDAGWTRPTGPATWGPLDPRALWRRLRSEGEPADPVERAAGLLWLQARAASGVPVWWSAGRLLASDGRGGAREAGNRGAGGMIRPRTIADRLGAIRGPVSVEVHNLDACALTAMVAPSLRGPVCVYADSPYVGATGYQCTITRADLVAMLRAWQWRPDTRIVVSEQVALVEELGPGWRSVCLRPGAKAEWLTTWGCGEAAHLGPLWEAR